eukprot:751776-Hanusia_phi.AAC.3
MSRGSTQGIFMSGKRTLPAFTPWPIMWTRFWLKKPERRWFQVTCETLASEVGKHPIRKPPSSAPRAPAASSRWTRSARR